MKPSHFQTPRNLAECTFEVGYNTYPPVDRPVTLLETVIYGLLGIAVFALIGVLLAWRG